MNNFSLRFMHITVGVIGLLLLLYESPAFCGETWQPKEMMALIQEGLDNNLDIKSQEKQVESLEAEAIAAGALDDPMIGFGLANVPTDTFSFEQEPMTQKQFFVSQKIPWPGKQDLKSLLSSSKAQKAKFALSQKQYDLASQIAISYLNLGFLDQRILLNAELKSLIRQILDNSETRYAVGKGLQMDVLQGQLELSRLADEKNTLMKQRHTIENNINRLLSRNAFQSVAVIPKPQIPGLNLNKNFLIEQALQHNPELNQLKMEKQIAEIQVMLARKKYYPDFDVKVSYGQRDEDRAGKDLADFVSATVGLNLPIWKHQKQDNRLAAANHKLRAASLSVDSLSAEIPFKIEELINEIESEKKNYAIYKNDILVQAQQWVDSAASAFEVDKLAFDTMINAHIRLLQLQLKQEEYLFMILKRYAEMEEILGSPLPGAS